MHVGIATPRSSRKKDYGDSETDMLGFIEEQNVTTMLAVHSPQSIPEHPTRQEHLEEVGHTSLPLHGICQIDRMGTKVLSAGTRKLDRRTRPAREKIQNHQVSVVNPVN